MRKRVAKIRHEIGMIFEKEKKKLQYRFLQKLLLRYSILSQCTEYVDICFGTYKTLSSKIWYF